MVSPASRSLPRGVSRFALAWGFALLAATLPAVPVHAVTFSEIARQSGIEHTFQGHLGGGVAIEDFDNDGDFDIAIAGGVYQKNRLYENLGLQEGSLIPTFLEITDSAGLRDIGHSKGVVFADVDNDGLPDLLIGTYDEVPPYPRDDNFVSSLSLYHNNGDKTFTDITQEAGLFLTNVQSFGIAVADVDEDGWLDLVLGNRGIPGTGGANYLFHNRGDGTFEDVSDASGIGSSLRMTLQPGFFDYDNDGDQDLYCATDKGGGNQMFRNDGTGTFTDVSVETNTDIKMDGMCVSTGDYDNDGDLDLFITNIPDGHAFFVNQGDGTFVNRAVEAGVAGFRIGWGSVWLDFNHDTLLDLYVVASGNPSENQLFRNVGNGTFTDVASDAGCQNPSQSYGLAAGDLDGNGNWDFVINNESAPTAVFLGSAESRPAISIKLIGIQSNWEGVGSRLTLAAGGGNQIREVQAGSSYLSQVQKEVCFGIGAGTAGDLQVRWPTGSVENYPGLQGGNRYRIIEGIGVQTGTVLLSHTDDLGDTEHRLEWEAVPWPQDTDFRIVRTMRTVEEAGSGPVVPAGEVLVATVPRAGRYYTWTASTPQLPEGEYRYDVYAAGPGGEALLFSSNSFLVETPPLPGVVVGQNFPNPFFSSTQIPVNPPEGASASIQVFDLAGRRVAEIPLSPGESSVQLARETLNRKGSGTPSGIYYYRMFVGGEALGPRYRMILLP